jgi:hypothetical protein
MRELHRPPSAVSGGSGLAGGARWTGGMLETTKISGTSGWIMFGAIPVSR